MLAVALVLGGCGHPKRHAGAAHDVSWPHASDQPVTPLLTSPLIRGGAAQDPRGAALYERHAPARGRAGHDGGARGLRQGAQRRGAPRATQCMTTHTNRTQPPALRLAPLARPRRARLAAASLHDAAEFPPSSKPRRRKASNEYVFPSTRTTWGEQTLTPTRVDRVHGLLSE